MISSGEEAGGEIGDKKMTLGFLQRREDFIFH